MKAESRQIPQKFAARLKFAYCHEHPFAFSPSAMLVMPWSQKRSLSFGGRILRLIKSAYHGWLSMMTSSEGPLFSLASGPPTLNPPLINSNLR